MGKFLDDGEDWRNRRGNRKFHDIIPVTGGEMQMWREKRSGVFRVSE